jgi:hypothetical protein
MKPDVVTIIASGPSAATVDLARARGYVIGVNDAALHAPCQVDAVVSMDRLWTEHRWAWLVHRCGPTWLRRSAVQNVKDRWDELVIFECNHETNDPAPGQINGKHSGACAMNLALQLQPRRVFLVGFDMRRQPGRGSAYWHPPHEWSHPKGATTDGKYAEWALAFAGLARAFKAAGVEVLNVCPQSAIADFRKITPKQYLQELKR